MTDGTLFDPLLDCLVETERHVAAAGWEQPPRLFALVHTARLLAMEPTLADRLDAGDPAALSSVEQEGLQERLSGAPADLDALLASLAWPEEVEGVALAVERLVLPASAAGDLPTDPAAMAEAVAVHPESVEVRLLAGVRRGGRGTCLLRQRDHDSDERVAIGHDIAPELLAALEATLAPDE